MKKYPWIFACSNRMHLMMKHLYIIFTAAAVLTLVTTADCFSQVNFTEVRLGCLNISELPKGDMIIRNQREYEELYQYLSPHPDCRSYVPPHIDFGNEILVSLEADVGGCSEPEREITITGSENSCSVKLVIKQMGICRALFQKQIFIVVKKTDCNKIVIHTETEIKK
jgi:hypothetical protein